MPPASSRCRLHAPRVRRRRGGGAPYRARARPRLRDAESLRRRAVVRPSSASRSRARLAAATLLLMDEPASGLNHTETDELARLIVRIPLLRSHRAAGRAPHAAGHGACRPVVVMHHGQKIADGTRPGERRPPGHRGLSGSRPMRPPAESRACMPATASRVLHEHRPRGRAARDRRAARRQRRRQDDDVARHLRYDPGAADDPAFDGKRRRARSPPPNVRGTGIAHVPQGRGTFVDFTVDGEISRSAPIR